MNKQRKVLITITYNEMGIIIDTNAEEVAQPKRTEERTETHACDLISRAMLLEYIHNEPVGKMLCDKYNLDGVIKQLPSAQPFVIHCTDCEDWYKRQSVWNVAISELPSAQPEPKWIPCSERLPEKPEQVLIYAWNVHYVLAKYREIRTWEGIYKMAWVMEDAYNAPHEIKHDVIAWMPLPEPYQAERREE